jgi:hypothetical protein
VETIVPQATAGQLTVHVMTPRPGLFGSFATVAKTLSWKRIATGLVDGATTERATVMFEVSVIVTATEDLLGSATEVATTTKVLLGARAGTLPGGV